jgi:hypothetical protein
MTRWVPAVLIGGVLGYGLIFLRELGWLIAVVVSLGLFIVYLRQGRLRDFGLLLVAQGVWPTFVASWGLVTDAVHADTKVGPESWIFLAVGVALLLTGVMVVAIAGRQMRCAAKPL